MLRRCIATLLLCTATAASAADLPAYPFLHVEATGFTVAPADIGQVDFEIAASHANPAQALAVVQARAAEIRALMEHAGLALDDIEVRDIRTQLTKGEAPVHELRAGVKITVRDLAKWKAVVGPLLEKPNLDGFMTEFDSTMREKIEADLLQEAIRQARRKADAIAAGFGRKVLTVGGFSTGPIKNLSRALDMAPSDYVASRSRAVPASPGDLIAVTALKLSQPVDVIFRLK
jgi:uncharacterized protein